MLCVVGVVVAVSVAIVVVLVVVPSRFVVWFGDCRCVLVVGWLLPSVLALLFGGCRCYCCLFVLCLLLSSCLWLWLFILGVGCGWCLLSRFLILFCVCFVIFLSG